MKSKKKWLAMALAVNLLLSNVPTIPTYASKTQIAVGGESVDIIYTTETQNDITKLYPMHVINMNEQIKLSSDQIKDLTSTDIELSLPHMVSYANVDTIPGFSANQSSSAKYREAITWLSANDKLHLPETVNLKYSDYKAELPKASASEGVNSNLYSEGDRTHMTYPLNQGSYKFTFKVPPNKYELKGSVVAKLNGTVIMSETDVYDETFSTEFNVGDNATLVVDVKEEKFTDENGNEHKTPWGHNTNINQNLSYPTTYTPVNVDKVVDYSTSYENIYANPNTEVNKSLFVMDMMKVVDKVQYSRPLLINSAYTKKLIKGVSQHISAEPLEQSPYAKYAGEFGVDVGASQIMVDYTHFGTRLFFTSPNVYENYIETALEKGIIKSSELSPKNTATIELYAKFAGYTPAYSSDNTPVRYNYPNTYDPLGIVSGKILDSTRLETLWRLQLIPQDMNFSSVIAQTSEDSKKNINRSFLGKGYTFTGKPASYKGDDANMNELLRDSDNLELFVNSTQQLKTYLSNLPTVDYNTKQPFANTYTVNDGTGKQFELKEIKALSPTLDDVHFFSDEKLEVIDALRLLYEAIQVYSEPTMTKLEIDAVNSMFGVQLNSVNEDDKEMLEYFFAKGILNPEESGILNLYQKATNDFVIQLLYRVANPDARYTIKTNLTSTDSQLLDKGYSQIEASKSSGSSNISAGKPVVPESTNVVYVRLEEVFLKDKNGSAYAVTGKTGSPENLNYNPSSYSVDNNLFGLYSSTYNENQMTYNPQLSMYYLGPVEINYNRKSDGLNRKTIWLKYSLPKDFNMSGFNFDSAGNDSELPSSISGFSNRGGYYYVPRSQKLSFLGESSKFDLRSGQTTIKQKGGLSFSYTNKPLQSGDEEDIEDVYELWKFLNPSSAKRLENGSYVISTGEQIAPGNENENIGSDGNMDISQLDSASFLDGMVMDLYATETPKDNEGETATSDTGTNTNTNSNIFAFNKADAKLIRFQNYKLFDSTGETLNLDAIDALKDKFEIVVTIQDSNATTGQVRVLFTSTSKQGVNLTSFVEENIKVSISTGGTVPIGLMYFQYDDGTGEIKTLIKESALSDFGIKVFEDENSNTKVLQNTSTGVYAVLSDGTNTCIIGNEFRHYDEQQGMIEITDNGIYYNFDIVKKLMGYNDIVKIDATIVADKLQVISTETSEVQNLTFRYNDVNTDIKPLMMKDASGNYYLNLNGLGYGASYIMKTWDSTEGEYTMLIEFKYSDLPLPTVKPGFLISENHTLARATYGKYTKILEEHLKSVYTENTDAMKRLALSNLVLHWAMYDSAKLPDTIDENYISNPYVEPKFTLFKNGEKVSPSDNSDLLNEIYLTLSRVSKISKISSGTSSSLKPFKISELITENDYLTSRFTTDSRAWMYDTYKHQLVLKLNKTGTTDIGDVSFIASPSGKGGYLKGYSKTRYTGFSDDQIPIHSESWAWADITKKVTYTINGRTFRAYGPVFLVGTNGAQYIFDSLIEHPAIVTPTNPELMKAKMTGSEVNKAFAEGTLFSGFGKPYEEYPFTKTAIVENTLPFLEGNVGTANELKLNFIAPARMSLQTSVIDQTQATLTAEGVIYTRYPDNTIRAHWYYGTNSDDKARVSTYSITDEEVTTAISSGKKIYVQYSYLIGMTDLYKDKSDTERTDIKFSKPSFNYYETIDPVLDINTTIAKSLLSSRIYDSYFNNKNGTTSVNVGTTGKVYLRDLEQGDVLILRDKGNIGTTDIVTVSAKPVSNKYVPVVGLIGNNESTLSPLDAMREGRSRILINTLLQKKIFVVGSVIPLSKLTDINSVQIATDNDFRSFMKFYSTLVTRETVEDSSSSSSVKSVFNESNKAFKENLINILNKSVGSSTMKFLVQASVDDYTQLKGIEYTDNWTIINSKPFEETEYEQDGYSYLARYDLYPYIEVEWVADYSEDPDNKSVNGIYRISGVNTASGQNVSAFANYANYLKEDFNSIDKLYGKQKLWDKYYMSSGMLTSDDLDEYINSITPDYDRKTLQANKSQYWAENLLGSMLITVQVILLLWGLILFSCYTLCMFSLGRLFVTKFKLLKMFTFGRNPNAYDVNVKKSLIGTTLYLLVVVTVFYSGTWGIIADTGKLIKDTFGNLYEYLDALMKLR